MKKLTAHKIAPPAPTSGGARKVRAGAGLAPALLVRAGSSPKSGSPRSGGGGGLLLLLLALPLTAHARDAKAPKDAPPAMPRVQAQAFALGYALRTADTRARAFTQSVEQLRSVDDDAQAGAEVARLSRNSVALRLSEKTAYAQVAAQLKRMGAPESLQTWASGTVAGLTAPVVPTKDAKELEKKEPDTAQVLSTLAELQTINAGTKSRQQSLTTWLALTGGKVAVWSAETGAYTADLHRAATGNRGALPSGAARALLVHAPADAPAATRQAVADLIPTGGGNLQALATVPPADFTPEKLARVCGTLLSLYGANELSATLDEAAKDGE